MPILFLGLQPPEHGAYIHRTNILTGARLQAGMKAFAHYLMELAKMGKR